MRNRGRIRTVRRFSPSTVSCGAARLSTRHQLVEQLQDWCRRAEASGIDELQKFARKLCSYASLSALAFRKVNGAIQSELARMSDAFAPASP